MATTKSFKDSVRDLFHIWIEYASDKWARVRAVIPYTSGEEELFTADTPGNVAITPVFGEPTLTAAQNGDAHWSRASATETVAALQKGSTGWVADLYGGPQENGKSWGAVYIPVNELLITLLETARWTYWLIQAEDHGVNMVVWVHDPEDLSRRAEITQAPSHADLDRASGWNSHELDSSVSQFFYLGEGVTGTDLITDEGPDNQFTWAQFQGDACFSAWTIYRISFEFGWYDAVDTFLDAYVADIILNGVQIPLKPDSGGTGRIGRRHFTCSEGDAEGTLEPKTPYRLLALDIHCSAVPQAAEPITLTKTAWQGPYWNTLIFSADMGSLGVSSVYQTFEGYEIFMADDTLTLLANNSVDDNWGITIIYQTVFGGSV